MKKENIIIFIVALLTLGLIILMIINPFSKKEENDALKFKKEYEALNEENVKMNINKDNPIIYSSYDEIINVIEDGTGVILFGFPECPWCRNAIPVLLEAAKDLSIEKIYYYNALSIRDVKKLDSKGEIIIEKEGTEEYKKIVKLLYEYLPVYEGLNDETVKRLYFPTVLFVKEGNIIGLHTSTVNSQKNPKTPLTNDQRNELKNIYTNYMNEVFDILCDQSC